MWVRVVISVVLPLAVLPAATADARKRIAEAPVAFEVVNQNRSGLACAADGQAYTLRGTIVGPRRVIAGRARPRGATLYLHEISHGRFIWHFPQQPDFEGDYDYAAALARRGHVSVLIDRLGYDDSDHPYGALTCLGAHADMASQVVAQLRAGGYAMGSGTGPAFGTIGLAGQSGGAAIAEIEAYSFGGIDALVNFAWAEQGFTQGAIEHSLMQGAVCFQGGEESEPGGPGAYAYYGQTEADFREILFHDAEEAVMVADFARRNRDPCGDSASIPPATQVNGRRVGEIHVPILLAWADADFLFDPSAAEAQRDLYSGSDDFTLARFPNMGHALMLERGAAAVRRTVSGWLAERGL